MSGLERVRESLQLVGKTSTKTVDRLVWVADDLDDDTARPKPGDDLEVGRITILCLVNHDLAETTRKRRTDTRGETFVLQSMAHAITHIVKV